MINTYSSGGSLSNAYITALGQASRQFRARFLINGSVLDCDIESIECHKGSCASDLSIGCVYAPYIEATLKRCETNIDGEELEYQVGLYVGNAYEYITLGKFKVIDPDKGNGSVSFAAVGTLSQVGNNAYSSSLTYPATVTLVVSELQAALRTATGNNGLTISFRGITPGSYTISKAITGQVRDVLGIIAGLYGGFVSEDNNGNIVIAAYNSGSSLSILPFRSQTIPAVRETPYEVTGIHITVKEADEDDEGEPIPEEYFEYGDPIIFQKNEWMTEALFDNRVVPNFVGLEFDLASIDISLGDPRLEPWDVIALTDLEENTYSVPCFEVVHTFDGGFSTEVIAEVDSSDASSVVVKGALEKYVERLDSNIFAAATAAATAKALAIDAQTSAVAAAASAGRAESAAGQANTILGQMQVAAAAAGTTLEGIYQDAADAASAADDAIASSTEANAYANSALDQLGFVEDVVGALDLISKHGDYDETQDPEVVPGKWYFTLEYVYSLTEDTEIDNSKTYYTRSGSGTELDPYVYTEVAQPVVQDIGTYYERAEVYKVVKNPTGDPSAQGWYELVGIEESIRNYVSSHLVVDGSGVWLRQSGSECKLQLTTTGIVLYDADGMSVAQYGTETTIGKENGFHIKLGANEQGGELGFYQGAIKVAYINGNKLYIKQSVVVEQMDLGRPDGEMDPITGEQVGFGQWSWKVHKNANGQNNLNLKWIG